MAKIPRDISGKELCRLLKKYNYEIIRQTGSHIRIKTIIRDIEHSLTIPDHDSIKIGTLNKILGDISKYLNIEKSELIQILFG